MATPNREYFDLALDQTGYEYGRAAAVLLDRPYWLGFPTLPDNDKARVLRGIVALCRLISPNVETAWDLYRLVLPLMASQIERHSAQKPAFQVIKGGRESSPIASWHPVEPTPEQLAHLNLVFGGREHGG
jgi:hypothetical protein